MSGRTGRRMNLRGEGGRRILLAGTGAVLVLAYLAGASLSGALSPLARRPLLDGLAPPPPYRWVSPPPEFASGNKPPSSGHATIRLGAGGSEVSASGTDDGQLSLVFDQGAVAASAGQQSATITIQPFDPAKLAPVPSGLIAAGNAYRIQARYQPSGKAASIVKGQVALIYPLLSVPVASPFDYLVLTSPDGHAWTRQRSTTQPGSHQVSAPVSGGGYVLVAVPPGTAAQSQGHSRRVLVLLIVAVVYAIIMVIVVGRWLVRRSAR
ncbi:MAG TPA: hypothetical protein VF995_00855 [Actinomycetota bacterium]